VLNSSTTPTPTPALPSIETHNGSRCRPVQMACRMVESHPAADPGSRWVGYRGSEGTRTAPGADLTLVRAGETLTRDPLDPQMASCGQQA
jgi:hypothetical protein